MAPAATGMRPAVARVVTPERPQRGVVAIPFTLVDDGDACRIEAEFSPDGGRTWRPAREAMTPRSSSVLVGTPGGASAEFSWDAALDLPANASSVRVRLTPHDRARGTPATTEEFVFLGDPHDPAIDFAPGPAPVIQVDVPDERGLAALRARVDADGLVTIYDERRATHVTGRLERDEIAALLLFAKDQGFASMPDSLGNGRLASSVPTQRIRIRTRLGERTVVARSTTPPPGFFELYRRLTSPKLAHGAPTA